MRPGELVLCIAIAAGLLVFALPVPGRLRLVAVLPALVAVAQLIIEGYRWQLIPAYLLAAAIGAWEVVSIVLGGRRSQRRRWLTAVTALTASVAFAVSVAVPALVPVFRFPDPGGPYAIGTVTYHWRDHERREIFEADPGARRELMTQIWYPAERGAKGATVPYVSDVDAFAPAAGKLLDIPGFVFSHFGETPTHAVEAAPIASDRPRHPVLVFASGLNGFRQSNMFQVEQLVSRGFVVVGIDQPHISAVTAFPDGRRIPGWTKDRLVHVIQQSITPKEPAPAIGDVVLPDGLFPYLSQDISFVLDELVRLNNSDPSGRFTGRLDVERAGALGISLGAVTVGQACHADPRLKACLMMDAAMPADVVRDGLEQPAMWLTRDADSILLERRGSGGWPDHEIRETLDTQRATFEKSESDRSFYVEIPGMFHLNYTDTPAWTPLAEALALSGPIGAKRGHEIVAAYTVAFFGHALGGAHPSLLDGPPPWDEVAIERR